MIQMLLHNRKQLIAGPTTSGPDRLPTTLAYRRPVMHGACLGTGDHHSIQRNLLESVLVLFAHRASLDELKTDWPHMNEKQRGQQHDRRRTGDKRVAFTSQWLAGQTQYPVRAERYD